MDPALDMKYFMVMWHVGANFGGMTTMCLHRARALHEARVPAPVLTFSSTGRTRETVDSLAERGYFLPGMEIINIFEYYRDLDDHWVSDQVASTEAPEQDEIPPAPEGPQFRTVVNTATDGSLFAQITTHLPSGNLVHRRLYRADGSTFFTDITTIHEEGSFGPRTVRLRDRESRPTLTFKGVVPFYRHWLAELTEGKPTTFIVDDKRAAGTLRSTDIPHALMLTAIHSNHVVGTGDPLRGKIAPNREKIYLESWRWDGVVFLTPRQRHDFEHRMGAPVNLFTVPNPSPRRPELPDPAQRVPARGVMIAGLEFWKDLGAAIKIIDKVHQQVPEVRLDIYGEGKKKEELQAQIDERGLSGVITLHGYVSGAKEQLATASFSMLTSQLEGMPLAVMEAMGSGCPSVSFDIRYGPADLIDHGVTGFLVPNRDIDVAAQHVVALCRDPELVARIGRKAWEQASRFDDAAVLDQWFEVVRTAWQQKPTRVYVSKFAPRVRAVRRLGPDTVRLTGTATWREKGKARAHRDLAARIQVLGPKGLVIDTPVRVTRRARKWIVFEATVTLAGNGELADLSAAGTETALVVTAQNFRKRVLLSLPAEGAPEAPVPGPVRRHLSAGRSRARRAARRLRRVLQRR